MTDYIVTPHKNEIPSSHFLSEELHRRGLPVGMDVKGTNTKWESIYFHDPHASETQCFLERNLHSLVYKIFLAAEPTPESEELQAALVEVLLKEVGGKVYDPDTKQSYDLKNFHNRLKDAGIKPEGESPSESARTSFSSSEILWMVFAWALVLGGLFVYQQAPENRKMFVLIATGLALVSAIGVTFSNSKPK